MAVVVSGGVGTLDDVDAVVVATDVERVFASRPPVHALGPVSLRIGRGEFVSIVGPSGCGKSTLLRIMAELMRPTAGWAAIERPDDDGGAATAMVFQDHGVFPWKTVRANLRFGLDILKVDRAEAERRVDHWLERLDLAAFADAFPSALSGGMRQRVGLGRALAVEPRILLLDEPFASLDAQLRELLQEELLEICHERNQTCVLVTHSIDEAIVLSDRIVVMSARPGRIIEEIEVPFERHRDPAASRAEAAYPALHERIWGLLRSEVTKTLGVRAGSKEKGA